MENHGNKRLCIVLNGKHRIWGLEKAKALVLLITFLWVIVLCSIVEEEEHRLKPAPPGPRGQHPLSSSVS